MDELEIRQDERRRIAEMCRHRAELWNNVDKGPLPGTWLFALDDVELAEFQHRAKEANAIAEMLEGP